jgi:hypothetical protein
VAGISCNDDGKNIHSTCCDDGDWDESLARERFYQHTGNLILSATLFQPNPGNDNVLFFLDDFARTRGARFP